MVTSVVPGTGSRRRYNPKYRIQLGPFIHGMNTVGDPGSLAETEAQLLVNYVIKPDGVLITRPPVAGLHSVNPSVVTNEFTDNSSQYYNMTEGPSDPLYVARANSASAYTIFYKGTEADPSVQPAHYSSVFGAGIGYTTPLQMVIYNGAFYYFSTTKMYSAPNDTSIFKSAIAGENGYGGTPNPATWWAGPDANKLIIRAAIIKDRMVIVTQNKIYWSKATDPTLWDLASTGGSITTANTGNDPITLDVFIVGNAVYLCRTDGLWRWTFTSDPNSDQLFERVCTTSVRGGLVYNNEIYVYNTEGAYRFVNGYLIEISSKIKNAFQYHIRNNVIGYSGNYAGMMFRMGHLLFFGPSFTLWNSAFTSYVNSITVGSNNKAGFYFVFDTILQAWTVWQFPYPSAAQGAISGPNPFANRTPFKTYYTGQWYAWTAYMTISGSAVFTMDSQYLFTDSQLSADSAFNTSGGNIYRPMGNKLVTKAIDLGDATLFKRFYKFIIDALHGTQQGVSNFKLITDGSTVNLIPADWDKLSYGKSYRAKELYLFFDGLTNVNTASSSSAPELTDIRNIVVYVSLSRNITT